MVSSYWVLVDIESRKLLKVDDVNIDNYYIGEFVELHKDKLKIPRDLELEEVGKKEIMYCDLDTNGHMNNTYYMDVISNYIPELPAGTHRIKSVRLHYSKEAPFGDTITIFRAKTEDDKYLFKTVKENGEMNIACEVGLIEL
jgi:acyl-ACP thioesterase